MNRRYACLILALSLTLGLAPISAHADDAPVMPWNKLPAEPEPEPEVKPEVKPTQTETPAARPATPSTPSPEDEKKARLFKAQMHAFEAGKLIRKNQFSLAQKEFRQAADYDPDNVDYLSGYANAAHKNNDWNAAAIAYTRLMRKDPSRKELYKSLGECLAQVQKYDDAVAAYKTAAQFEDDKGEMWKRIGSIRSNQGRYDEAMEAYRQSVKLSPKDGKGFETLAALEWKQGNKTAALKTYKTGVTNNPDDGDLQAAYAYALMGEQRWREASEAYKAAARTKGKNPAIEQGYKSAMDHIAYDEQMAKIKAAKEAKKKH
ncbi:MAG: tetratricopeptide repeat protein [Candidatus Obscuribacterales bacterium]|nr:tetratricopeptide repeat protein [Candidatus Obscuribacterales bacterium]